MTVANVYGLMIPPPHWLTADPAFNTMTVDASGEKGAFVVAAPKAGDIHKVHWRVGTVTTPTDTDVRLETVSATDGFPTGTLLGTTTNGTITSGSITSNTWQAATLTADATVTKGQLVAVVIAPSGTPSYLISSITGAGFPYRALYTGSWSSSPIARPVCALEYSDGSFALMPGVFPFSAINIHTFANNSTPDELALKFRLAAPVRVSGAWAALDSDGDVGIVLYDSDGTTALATASKDKDVTPATSGIGPFYFTFSSSQQLSASTYYRLAVKPSTTTSLSAYSFDVNSAAILDQLEGGQDFHYSSRTDAGAWSDTTTRRLMVGLIIDGIDDGAGAGGGGGPLIGGRLVR